MNRSLFCAKVEMLCTCDFVEQLCRPSARYGSPSLAMEWFEFGENEQLKCERKTMNSQVCVRRAIVWIIYIFVWTKKFVGYRFRCLCAWVGLRTNSTVTVKWIWDGIEWLLQPPFGYKRVHELWNIEIKIDERLRPHSKIECHRIWWWRVTITTMPIHTSPNISML